MKKAGSEFLKSSGQFGVQESLGPLEKLLDIADYVFLPA
jgi:hypothetical protein